MNTRRTSAALSFLVARSALHIGCGNSLGDIDQPVIRNEVTRHPCVPRSALKRSLKDALTGTIEADDIDALFGSERSQAGMLCPQEGQLLLLPVACAAGGAAWITCPMVLARFSRQVRACGMLVPDATPQMLAEGLAVDHALASANCPLRQRVGALSHIGLLDLWMQCERLEEHSPRAKAFDAWAAWLAAQAFAADDEDWTSLVASRVVLVHDLVFDALAERLGVRARNVIGENGLVENLWREENVPDDTVFYAVLSAQPLAQHRRRFGSAAEALVVLPKHASLQVGGNASLGQGLVDCVVMVAPEPGGADE